MTFGPGAKWGSKAVNLIARIGLLKESLQVFPDKNPHVVGGFDVIPMATSAWRAWRADEVE